MQSLAGSFPDTAFAVRLDVADPKQPAQALQQAKARGAIDLLVNNVGIDAGAMRVAPRTCCARAWRS
jgi:NAD(P)-dependent dehydrogenase (short-subunit alcohol dehydrogenase family)